MQTTFIPNIISNKHAELSKIMEKSLRKKLKFFPLTEKIERNSSHVLKISAISLVLCTHEFTDIFNTFDEIYLTQEMTFIFRRWLSYFRRCFSYSGDDFHISTMLTVRFYSQLNCLCICMYISNYE